MKDQPGVSGDRKVPCPDKQSRVLRIRALNILWSSRTAD
jgi:hypothetical protein